MAAQHPLDKALERVKECLPKIVQRAQKDQQEGKTPTSRFCPKSLRTTRQEFQAMADDPLLTESRDDIRMNGNGHAA